MPEQIPLSVPDIGPAEMQAVQDALAAGWVSTAGPQVPAFEAALSACTGSPHVVALNSGTAALHLALLALGTQPGDIVVAPNFTYTATLNAIAHAGARPVLIDIDPDSLQMNPALLERYLHESCVFQDGQCKDRATGARVRAILPVHVLGYPCDMGRILATAQSKGIPVVEDAAAAIGSRQHGRHLGTQGIIGILSFNGNKVVTTGGGGALLTHDALIARHSRHLGTQARSFPTEYIHDAIGFNYGMTSMAAALGTAQLSRLPAFISAKQAIHARYRDAFAGTDARLHDPQQDGLSANHWLEMIRYPQARALEAYLNAQGIAARKLWVPMNRLPMHAQAPYIHDRDHSQSAYEESLCLPASSSLSPTDQDRVIDAVRGFRA